MPNTTGKMILLGGDKLASDYCICVREASVLTLQMRMVILGMRSCNLSFVFPLLWRMKKKKTKPKTYFVYHVRF